jgi:hypothetical protein
MFAVRRAARKGGAFFLKARFLQKKVVVPAGTTTNASAY